MNHWNTQQQNFEWNNPERKEGHAVLFLLYEVQ